MDTVTLSPKFEVVFPPAIRKPMGLAAGEKFWVTGHGDRMVFIRVGPIRQMRGFLRGMDTIIEREDGCP
jgi:bifunctional DNA-binding transcriptional regulator/antitoxin component of YhaV-PrlF toxin-antitoxin module